jgi:putative membrane protein
MQFLRTACWVFVAVVIALFSKANWDIAPSYTGRVPVKLWADIILEVRLPVLIVAAFLLGLLPMWIFARLHRWRMRRKLETAEQALAVSAAPSPLPVVERPEPSALPRSPEMPDQP